MHYEWWLAIQKLGDLQRREISNGFGFTSLTGQKLCRIFKHNYLELKSKVMKFGEEELNSFGIAQYKK